MSEYFKPATLKAKFARDLASVIPTWCQYVYGLAKLYELGCVNESNRLHLSEALRLAIGQVVNSICAELSQAFANGTSAQISLDVGFERAGTRRYEFTFPSVQEMSLNYPNDQVISNAQVWLDLYLNSCDFARLANIFRDRAGKVEHTGKVAIANELGGYFGLWRQHVKFDRHGNVTSILQKHDSCDTERYYQEAQRNLLVVENETGCSFGSVFTELAEALANFSILDRLPERAKYGAKDTVLFTNFQKHYGISIARPQFEAVCAFVMQYADNHRKGTIQGIMEKMAA